VAGLRCAMELATQGVDVCVLEAADQVGGRVRTETVDGFQLDVGFQVLLTAYAECQTVLDYPSLRLGHFEPGAFVWNGKQFAQVIDPWRRPARMVQAALSPVGSLADKLRVAKLKSRLKKTDVASIYAAEDIETHDWLQQLGFSQPMIETFFRPFYTGIFLENELATSSRMFEFVFKMFGEGYAALPAAGMQAIPLQMARQLQPDTVRLNHPVTAVDAHSVTLANGARYTAAHVVLATPMSVTAALLPGAITDRGWHATHCHYFYTDAKLLAQPMIALNASQQGGITNIAVPSDVSPSYSPDERSLVCVSTACEMRVGDVEQKLLQWFGKRAESCRALKSYVIPHALPRQNPGDNAWGQAPLQDSSGVWVCGDYRYSSSIQGAMASGRAVGTAVGKRVVQG